ncbi:Ribosomal RNA-processing protein 17 [Yarrowia sp. C11]|nr:Ribosomal RNA-processing protein 17 [Yarrowia sp. E02]KAG5373186.1 Ribosomal RNA-processing protein 17 [Yarrowia sp. C11]
MAATNRQILTQGDRSYAKKKTSQFGVDEVSYDAANRTEYLTGFRKRKLQRKEKAQEKAKEQARLDRIAERKKLRDERKGDQEKERVRMQKAMKDIERARSGYFSSDDEKKDDSDSDEDESDDEDETPAKKAKKASSTDEDDFSDWEGLDKPGVLKKQKKKYVDGEGKKTTVTIEAVSLDSDDDEPNNTYVDMSKADEVLQESLDKAGLAAVYSGMAEPKVKKLVKKPKKKFRYLSATERKKNLDKERARAKAKRTKKE